VDIHGAVTIKGKVKITGDVETNTGYTKHNGNVGIEGGITVTKHAAINQGADIKGTVNLG
jgi:hypothetical protein